MSYGDVHVLPINDLIEHVEQDQDCPCGPAMEPVERADGTIGWLITHHSLDGREIRRPRIKGSGDHNWEPWSKTTLGRGRKCQDCGREDDGYQQPCERL